MRLHSRVRGQMHLGQGVGRRREPHRRHSQHDPASTRSSHRPSNSNGVQVRTADCGSLPLALGCVEKARLALNHP